MLPTVDELIRPVPHGSDSCVVPKRLLQEVLDGVLRYLAKQVVKDGEGATKLVEVAVKGALTRKEAHKIAETVANSNVN